MRLQHKRTTFTAEQIKQLASNPFTYRVDAHRILFTLEFKNLFIARYETGDGCKQIFSDYGYDVAVLGDNRVYGFARRLMAQIDAGIPLTETPTNEILEQPKRVDYNTVPVQQSVAAMQREIAYLRQQVDFLKKLTELDNGKKPRN